VSESCAKRVKTVSIPRGSYSTDFSWDLQEAIYSDGNVYLEAYSVLAKKWVSLRKVKSDYRPKCPFN
jgi:hypothetical protein